MAERYPGYDVLAKRNTPSWNVQTRRVIDQRLAVPREPRFFTAEEFRALEAVTNRITPQPPTRPPIPLAALIDDKLMRHAHDGYRAATMPREGEAWKRGLRAIDAEATARHGSVFAALKPEQQDDLLRRIEEGDAHNEAWGGMPPKIFFKQRILPDTVRAYYAHPTSWNEIGFGGPASPRGYVRLRPDRRDSWEAIEAHSGNQDEVRRENRRVG